MTAVAKAKEIFSWAGKEIPSGSGLEVYLCEERGRSAAWSEKKCEDLTQSEGGGAGVRVILRDGSSGRQGYAYATGFSRESVGRAARSAADSARLLPADPHRSLPDKSSVTSRVDPAALTDPTAFSDGIPAILDRLREGESRTLKRFPLLRSILRAGFSEGRSESAVVNSNGVEESCSGTFASFGVGALAEKDGERQEGGFGLSRRFRKDLDWESIFDHASRRAIALLGGRPVPSGKMPVVFDPTVGCEFLSLVAEMVSAESVQKGKSPFKGRLGEAVASRNVTIVDDGTLPGGLATSPADDEGVPTRKTAVISGGVLNSFLYDTYSASKDGVASTGNAVRASFKGSPGSGHSNFYLDKGPVPPEEILGRTRGLYLYEVMGLHMADPVSGDFSVGVIGARLENGELREGVRGVTLAGNLLDLLKNIDLVGDDLTFFGSLGCPTFRVGGLMVGGA